MRTELTAFAWCATVFCSDMCDPQLSKEVKSEITQDGMRIESNWDQVSTTCTQRIAADRTVQHEERTPLAGRCADRLLRLCYELGGDVFR